LLSSNLPTLVNYEDLDDGIKFRSLRLLQDVEIQFSVNIDVNGVEVIGFI